MHRLVREFSELVSDIAVFERKANASAEVVVASEEIRELILGTGLAPDTTDEIIAGMPIYVPELIKEKITGYVIHNAVTAYASHENRTEEGFEFLSRAANKLLVVDDYQDMIEAGREKIKILAKK